jgi:hypothetical protein
MHKFLNGSLQAYADLEQRAKAAAYINFREEELPPGCVPPQARVGFKVDPASGESTLFVERGIRYYGPDATIRRWIEAGQLFFASFAELRQWICTDLKTAFELQVNIGNQPTEESGSSTSAAPAEPERPCPAPSPQPSDDPVLQSLLELVVKQTGARHGLDVRTVDPSLTTILGQKLRSNTQGTTPDAIVDEVLAGPFSLAALQRQGAISVHAGPPITCIPIPQNRE